MKIEISIHDSLFQAGEDLAQQLKVSRSRLYSDALAAYLSPRSAADVTARLNGVYCLNLSTLDPTVAHAQLESLVDENW
jgi:metal-responsive CopG/Arc/MetJ family transcriptional regulator